MKNMVIKHLKGDINTFKDEANEDRELIGKLRHKPMNVVKTLHKSYKKSQPEIKKVMTEFKEGKLHSGSKKGPKVTKRKQAIAIAMSESRKAKKKK